ncbi:MAG: zinc ABC transporter solute-binding protein [Chloroflexaceae bacterium]|nr:zinc ABC transporter solute-binding protein [Chloroflexaceae bacterium]
MICIFCHQRSLGMTSLLLGLWLVGCDRQSPPNTDQSDRPQVVSTSTIIADLTKTIGGDEITHVSILDPGADPHVYEPVPADSVALETADLIFYNGYNLEPGLIRLIEAAGIEAEKVAVAETIPPLDSEYEGQREPDPHVWGDVQNVILMVQTIRDRLMALSPEDRQEFSDNAEGLIEELEQLDRWIEAQIQTIPAGSRQLVTTHDAFQYYGRAYGLEIPGTLIGISTEEQPSARTVKELADAIKRLQIKAIFAETTINPALIKAVAKESGVALANQALYSDSIGASGSDGDSYLKMQVANTRAIVGELGGQFRSFQPSAETNPNSQGQTSP